MHDRLPINDSLLQLTIENNDIKYKTNFNLLSVIHMLCVFAYDFYDLSSDYILSLA